MNPKVYEQEMVSVRSRFVDGWAPVLQCHQGWYWVIMAAHHAMSRVDLGYRFYQIKEKFGSLRLYVLASDTSKQDELLAMASRFEYLSSYICEMCGAIGALRRSKHRIYFTACEEHSFGCAAIPPYDDSSLNEPDPSTVVVFESGPPESPRKLLEAMQEIVLTYERERAVCDKLANALIHTLGEGERHWPREAFFLDDIKNSYDWSQDAYIELRGGVFPEPDSTQN